MGVCLSSSETKSKFMGSTQYSVMAERSSRRRGVKRTTRHKLRVCELMDATEGNNLKFSKKSLTVGVKIKKAKTLPPSVLRPFRSWMATARRRVRANHDLESSAASCSDTSSDTVTLPPSVLGPFRSWMATARRVVRESARPRVHFDDPDVTDSAASFSDMSSDTVPKSMDPPDSIGAATDRPTVPTTSGRGFVLSVSNPEGMLSCQTPLASSSTSCSESVCTTMRSREHSLSAECLLPNVIPPGLEI